MSPLPARFTDRWRTGSPRESYDDAVCWHLLLGGDAGVKAMAADAQRRLARFDGLHMTPLRWLHVTVMRVGTAEQVTRDGIDRMLASARSALAETPPLTVRLGRVFYHPEAIVVGASPPGALAPVLAAARAAVPRGIGACPGAGSQGETWAPHLTLCYSTGEQPAAPVIAELGRALPGCEVTVDTMSLVVQAGPEQAWDWRIAGTVRLPGRPGAGPAR
jgi:2'-5' RNA ligase